MIFNFLKKNLNDRPSTDSDAMFSMILASFKFIPWESTPKLKLETVKVKTVYKRDGKLTVDTNRSNGQHIDEFARQDLLIDNHYVRTDTWSGVFETEAKAIKTYNLFLGRCRDNMYIYLKDSNC